MIKRVQELGKELDSNSQNLSMSLESSTYTTVEPTLLKLNEFINQRIKLSDFTVDDKHNLVELFVTHKRTLMQIYQSIFP